MGKANQTHNAKNNIVKVLTAQELDIQKSYEVVSQPSFSRWVHVLRQNWRQGTVGCKGRSDVNRTTKKPWKQKGTGRARAGSARSPLWRGGGVIFGPQPRVRTLKIAKKLKKKILQGIFFDFLNKGKILCVDWIVKGKVPSTSAAYNLLKQLNMTNQKITFLVSVHDMLTYASFANIPCVRVLYFDQSNAFDLVDSKCLIFMKKDLEQFKGMVLPWI